MSTSPGIKIKELRKIYGMSQEELGRRVGVQRAAINKYEKGTVENIPIKTIEKIANIFEVSPTYIVGWDNLGVNPLAMEVKIIQGVKHLYGKEVLDLLESYLGVSNVGKKKIEQYVDDMWKLYHNRVKILNLVNFIIYYIIIYSFI